MTWFAAEFSSLLSPNTTLYVSVDAAGMMFLQLVHHAGMFAFQTSVNLLLVLNAYIKSHN